MARPFLSPDNLDDAIEACSNQDPGGFVIFRSPSGVHELRQEFRELVVDEIQPHLEQGCTIEFTLAVVGFRRKQRTHATSSSATVYATRDFPTTEQV